MVIEGLLNGKAWLRFRPYRELRRSRGDSPYTIHLDIPATLLREGKNRLRVHLDEIPGMRDVAFIQRPKIRYLCVLAVDGVSQ